MKFRTLMCINAIIIFAALMSPVRLVAQEDQNCHKEHQRYKLVDVGTFGGPNSYFTNMSGRSLDKKGVATGAADTPTAVNPPFLLE